MQERTNLHRTTYGKAERFLHMSMFKKFFAQKDEDKEMTEGIPRLWNYARAAELDEETIYAICKLIDRVGYQIKADWDWDWLKKSRRGYHFLLNRSLMNSAWNVLAKKDWLSLQTTDDRTRKITTIAPLEGLTNLRTLVLQNNLVTDLQPLFLDAAIARGDTFVLVTEPLPDALSVGGKLTGFGREIQYLKSKGYIYDPTSRQMVKKP